MLYRIQQFYQGLSAKVTTEDIAFIREHLTPEEHQLFFQLRISEQRHSLNVAYGCRKEAPHNTVLIKAALLHDIGKVGSNLTLINKSFVVLIKKFQLKNHMLPSFLKEAIYFKNNHAEIGYTMLLPLNLDPKILFLVKNHHNNNTDNIEDMKILQKYDNIY
ncbi:MAG: HD domain-containing protein [Clostridiaceae bacterium]|nr:HD domain-containing protein [Clostridiaceae bacterium]